MVILWHPLSVVEIYLSNLMLIISLIRTSHMGRTHPYLLLVMTLIVYCFVSAKLPVRRRLTVHLAETMMVNSTARLATPDSLDPRATGLQEVLEPCYRWIQERHIKSQESECMKFLKTLTLPILVYQESLSWPLLLVNFHY